MDSQTPYLTVFVFYPQVMFVTLENRVITHILSFLPTERSRKLLIDNYFLAAEALKSLCIFECHYKGGQIIFSAERPLYVVVN